LIAPVEVSNEFVNKFFPEAWQAVRHEDRLWGYPIALETVTLIYNKKLLVGAPPRTLSDLAAINQKIKQSHPGIMTILWDYKSPYYSWGILASAGAYVFRQNGTSYDVKNVGVANLKRIIELTTGLSNYQRHPVSNSCSRARRHPLL
jgi:maltose/maltodextrin transport system substrate-binding protein